MEAPGLSSGHVDNLSSLHDVVALRAAKDRAELKLSLLQKKQEEELGQYDETKMVDLLKNNGAREYIGRLREKNRIQDSLIGELRQDLEVKAREITELREKNRDTKRQLNEYVRALRGAQIAKDFCENGPKVPHDRDSRRLNNQNSVNISSASSMIDSLIPPPPPTELSFDDIIHSMPSLSKEEISIKNVNIDIPPPPPVDANIEEIIDNTTKKAFQQKEGQHICHAYVNVNDQTSRDLMDEVIDIISNKQGLSANPSDIWTRMDNFSGNPGQVNVEPHVTLVRGHRAIYFHQIKPLVEAIRKECLSIKPFSLVLDRLEIFNNNENTRQFLCLAVKPNQSSNQVSELNELKFKLKKTIDQFATRLTSEDETIGTVAHCSLMRRDVACPQTTSQVEEELELLDTMLSEALDEFPVCVINVNEVKLTVGNHTYQFGLSDEA